MPPDGPGAEQGKTIGNSRDTCPRARARAGTCPLFPGVVSRRLVETERKKCDRRARARVHDRRGGAGRLVRRQEEGGARSGRGEVLPRFFVAP